MRLPVARIREGDLVTALPPIGTRVRCKATGYVGTVLAHGRVDLARVLVEWADGREAFLTADEMEETDDE
jgi:hypothetical protein